MRTYSIKDALKKEHIQREMQRMRREGGRSKRGENSKQSLDCITIHMKGCSSLTLGDLIRVDTHE